jgi:hypothetical protein
VTATRRVRFKYGDAYLMRRFAPFKKLAWSGQAGVGWTVHVWT